MKFNEKLIELRKQKGLSQEELGYKINVSRQTVSKWEAEQTRPEIEKVRELSKVFGVSIEYLLNDEVENAKETIITNTKKKTKKVVLIVALTVLAIYILITIPKFIILLGCSIKANNIADYENYSITMFVDSNNKLNNEVLHSRYDEVYSNGIQLLTNYNGYEKVSDITYINLEGNKAYNLIYDQDLNKYVYSDIVMEDGAHEQTTIKDISKESFPNTFGQILLSTISPSVKVSVEENNVYIRTSHKGGYTEVSINKETGIVNNKLTVTDTQITNISYNYTFDQILEEPNLEDFDYILLEETE